MLHQLFHTACGATGAGPALQIYVCNICTRREHGAAARARGAAGCARMLPRRYEFFTFSGFLKVIYFMWQVRNSVKARYALRDRGGCEVGPGPGRVMLPGRPRRSFVR